MAPPTRFALALSLALVMAIPTILPATAAGEAGVASAPAWGPLSSAIRPGSSATIGGAGCTLNFVFYDATHAYIGTAAHCTKINDRVRTGSLTFGTVVYDSDTTSGADAAVDFSLIRIDGDKIANTNPTMRGWGGPSGIATRSELKLGDQVGVFGYGIGFGSTEPTRNRTGVLVSTTAKFYRADMVAVNGDSGGPVIDVKSGKALGVVSHYGIGIPPTTDEGPLMTFVMAELSKAGFSVTMATG